MSKNLNDICFLVQARLGSQRIPGKMLKPFSNTTLIDILFTKLLQSSLIPKSNLYFSVYEEELKLIGKKYNINIFNRSETSSKSEGQPLTEIYEWHDKLPFKYVVLISACNPLLTIKTIDNFTESFIKSDKEGAFAVFEKRTYYWGQNGKSITNWKNSSIMNTKLVEPIYESAHCLYASRLDIISQGYWMDANYPPQPELYVMGELEAFDIDYEWQFQLGEQLYKMDLC
jgi:CMP-N-acetylneuraminic acid synthetase